MLNNLINNINYSLTSEESLISSISKNKNNKINNYLRHYSNKDIKNNGKKIFNFLLNNNNSQYFNYYFEGLEKKHIFKDNSFILGIDENINLIEDNLDKNILITGSAGSGKSVFQRNIYTQQIKNKKGLFLLDNKNDRFEIKQFINCSNKLNRKEDVIIFSKNLDNFLKLENISENELLKLFNTDINNLNDILETNCLSLTKGITMKEIIEKNKLSYFSLNRLNTDFITTKNINDILLNEINKNSLYNNEFLFLINDSINFLSNEIFNSLCQSLSNESSSKFLFNENNLDFKEGKIKELFKYIKNRVYLKQEDTNSITYILKHYNINEPKYIFQSNSNGIGYIDINDSKIIKFCTKYLQFDI